jgi:hypothetical protein
MVVSLLIQNPALEIRKQKALETLRSRSKALTEPSADSSKPPHNKYTLRGVCTLPHVTYVLRRSAPASSDVENNTEVESGGEWQWWRISFSIEDKKARLAEVNQTAAVPSLEDQAAWKGTKAKKKWSVQTHGDVAGYTTRKVREIEVLKAAREESNTVLLVYANSNAVNFKEDIAPQELQV